MENNAEDNLIDERFEEENDDAIDSIIPPEDIIAFNEQRSCADIFRLYTKKQLDIEPDFQRGIVWPPKAQTLFIDSLIKQLPIPSMCISLDIKTQKRVVIDGLQRIASIIRFLDPESNWTLAKCEDVDERISGKKITEIKEKYPILYEKLENLTIAITVLRCDYAKANHMEYLFQIFHRLNSGGNKLLNQEIRNCIYQGPFNSFLKKYACSSSWLHFFHLNQEQVKNMRFSNEERILRFLAFYYNQDAYKGRLATFLNNFMAQYRKASGLETLANFQILLDETIQIASLISIQPEDLKNKNLVEAIFIGIAHNIASLKTCSQAQIQNNYRLLSATPPFTTDRKEGLSHTDKVFERLNAAIGAFNNANLL